MGLIENFAQSIRGLEKPVVTGWDGYKACELAVAAHLSLKSNKTIELPLKPDIADNEIKDWLS
jgi:predicted dehydrogenase